MQQSHQTRHGGHSKSDEQGKDQIDRHGVTVCVVIPVCDGIIILYDTMGLCSGLLLMFSSVSSMT